MPPKRRRQDRVLGPSSPDHQQGPSSTRVTDQRTTRSGKVFAGSSTARRGSKPARRQRTRPGPLTPAPPQVGQKRRVVILESEDSDNNSDTYRPRNRRRREDHDQPLHGQDERQKTPAGVDTAPPRIVSLPWGFSLPVTELGQAERHHILFSQVSEAELKSVLQRIGCSVVGQNKPQLIKLVLAYATLIESLPVQHPNISPSRPAADPAQSTIANNVLDTSQQPSNNACGAQREANPSSPADLIRLSSVGPSPQTSAPHRTLVPPSSGNIPQSQSALGVPNSSMPDLTPDRPGDDTTSDDESTSRNNPSLHELQKKLIRIEKTLVTHSEKMTALQEDTALTHRNQGEIKELLQAISDHQLRSTTTRASRSSTAASAKTKPTRVPRAGKVKDLIHFHFQALFGVAKNMDVPLSPPTAQEKKRWRTKGKQINDGSSSYEESEENTDSEASRASQTDEDSVDPQFPYRDGPGHPNASEETLKIMYEMLKEKGISRFRLDLTAPPTSPENRFCLGVARDIFVRLVECEEYDGLTEEEKDPEAILCLLTTYVKERLVRRRRETQAWPKEKQAERSKKRLIVSRRRNLINIRLESALEIGGLKDFRPIIQNCCSDDESDGDVPAAATSETSRNKTLKFCKVRRLGWRSGDVTKAFILLDTYRERKLAGNPSRKSGVQPRIRRRPEEPPESELGPPEATIPRDAYDTDWLESRDGAVISESLNISDQLIMKTVLKKLNDALR